ncbi:MAG: gamma-glutamyltransferase [Pseudomonadales bacterium]|nr:gamma-glutamyltransferase [Pseudomonadales bacterium]
MAAQPDAARAGAEMFALGGNAVDAAVATGFALAVVEPTMNGLGGRSQLLLRTADGRFQSFQGMTEIPAAWVAPKEPVRDGYGVVATPGVVANLARLHAEQGSLPWATVLAPAIRLAEHGFELLPGEAARHAYALEAIRDDPGFRANFLKPDGSTYAAGERFRQPALARTLRRLAEAGGEDFYRGGIAAEIAADMARNGGFVSADDLAAYEAEDGRLVHLAYRGHEVHSMAAPGGGGLVVRALAILARFDRASMGEAAWAAVVNQAIALALEGRTEDPGEQDPARLTDDAWVDAAVRSIRVPALSLDRAAGTERGSSSPAATLAFDWTGSTWSSEPHHTTHFTTADCAGTVVSITQTLGPVFGSKVVTPELGFAYASTMGAYLASAQQVPGTRPRTTIAPTIVTRDGEVVLVLGAAGGERILSGIVQVLSRVIDEGRSLSDALAAPRVHPFRAETGNGDRVVDGLQMHVETTPGEGWPEEVLDGWTRAGFTVHPNEARGAFSRVHAIARSERGWIGGADPDWEGIALPAGGVRCPD